MGYCIRAAYQTIVDAVNILFEQIAGCVMEAVRTNSSIMCTGEAAAFQA